MHRVGNPLFAARKCIVNAIMACPELYPAGSYLRARQRQAHPQSVVPSSSSTSVSNLNRGVLCYSAEM